MYNPPERLLAMDRARFDEDVAAIRAGDPDATRSFLLRWRPVLLWRLRHVHGVPGGDAEDVLQETFRRFLSHAVRAEHPRRLLMIIGETAASDYHRRRTAAHRAMARLASGGGGSGDDAEARLVARLDAARLLSTATGKCVELLTKIMLEGATHAEYAQGAGVPRGSVGPAVARCLARIRRELRDRDRRRMKQAG